MFFKYVVEVLSIMRKTYTANGYVAHRKAYLVSIVLWFLIAGCAFLLRSYELHYAQQKLISLIPFIILFLITGYMLYMVKKTEIKLEVDDAGIVYEGADRKGIRFNKFRRELQWNSVKSFSLVHNSKGPIKIILKNGDALIYWNIVDLNQNNNIVEELTAKLTC